MTLDFQWNEDDFAESQRLGLPGQRDKVKAARTLFVLFVISLIISGKLWQRLAHIPLLTWQVLLTAGLLTVVLTFVARFIGHWLTRWWFRRQYRNLPGVQLPMRIVTDKHGMIYTNARFTRRASWASIVKWRETKTSFLIYIKFSLFVLVPKRDMPPGQVSVFRELLSSKAQKS